MQKQQTKSNKQKKIKDAKKEFLVYNQKLGQGSYGLVHKAAFKDNPNQILACKIIIKQKLMQQIQESQNQNKPLLKSYLMNRVKQQILSWSKVNHPNIVKFLQFNENQKNIYLLMEYCQDGNLQRFIQTGGILSQDKAIPTIRDIISATVYLHQNNIIHRDIKAQNILLHKGKIKLADFGFAKLKNNPTKIGTGTSVGTPKYMAPQLVDFEQKARYSSKCDCWSIGILIYFILQGFYPFDATQLVKYKTALRKDEIKFDKNVQISDQMKKLIEGALRYHQQDRSSSIQMLKQIEMIIKFKNSKMDIE